MPKRSQDGDVSQLKISLQAFKFTCIGESWGHSTGTLGDQPLAWGSDETP